MTAGGADSLLARYADHMTRSVERDLAALAIAQAPKLERLDVLMHSIVRQSFDGVLALGADGRVQLANEAACRMFGRSEPALVGAAFDALFPQAGALPAELLAGGGGARWEGMARRRSGAEFPVEVALSRVEVGGEAQLVAVVRDVTEAKLHEQRLRYQATHDPLTGLANRAHLTEQLVLAIARSVAERQPLVLLLLDLDRFKEVNDTFGHHVGDVLLVQFAGRLGNCLRAGTTVARLGGDEFAVLLPLGADLREAAAVGQRIAEVVRQPFALGEGVCVEIGVSVGIAAAPEHATDAAKLLQCADIAMYAAKRNVATLEVYDRAKDHSSVRYLALTGAMRRAVERDELVLHYQPKVRLDRRGVCGVEALIRWKHPEHGMIGPHEFIPQAEQTGSIDLITRWAVEKAIAQMMRWRGAGLDIGVAINLSPRSVIDERLPDVVADLLAAMPIDPGLLTFELTETGMLHDPDLAARILRRLHDLGARLSVDDFGTGYSSLALLQRLAVDELKIDRSFVLDMTRNEQDLVLVRSTIELAHNLGLVAVAEGIEDRAQMELLRELGCDMGQGYLFSRPKPPADFESWLGDAHLARELDVPA